jgi:putative ABC transport system permease protein
VAFRQFRHQPTFAWITVLVLGLGTGAAATIFTIVDTVVLRPLPYERPDRLLTIWDTNTAQALSHDPISPVNFMDQRALPVFSAAAAWWRPGVNLTDPGLDPVRVSTIEVSANLFEVLGIRPQIGSGFPADPLFLPNEPLAVISDRLWRARYNADPSIVGRQLIFNTIPHRIAGIMPAKFHFPDDVDVWQRLTWDMAQHSRSAHFMEAVARLSDGTSIGEAQAAVDALWIRIVRDFGTSRDSPGQGWGSRLIPLLDEQLGYYRPALLILFGAVGLLLLIGVLNVASLLLTRSLAREREIAVRGAMGASPRQIVAQLTAESLVLALAGAILGVVAAAVAMPLVVAFAPGEIPRLDEASVSWPALGLALVIAVVTTVVLSVVPALLLLRGRMAINLKSGERGSSKGAGRLHSTLVAAEVALACALLVSSALLVRTVRGMMATPVGVQADGSVIATVQLTRNSAAAGGPRAMWQAIAETHARILENLRQQPGVVAAGATNFLPLEIGWRSPFTVVGQPVPADPNDLPQAQFHAVTEGYFEAMGATLVSGRAFTEFDGRENAPVVIVNESFARRYLPNSQAGQALRIPVGGVGPLGTNLISQEARSNVEVVGVVRDVRNVPFGQNVEPAYYLPIRQFPFSDVFVAVKSTDTAAGVAALRAAMRTAAPEVPVGAMRTWGERFGDRTSEPRLLMGVLLLFAVLAGLLSALGVYGLFSWSVALRTRELAIRLALGAKPASVGSLVLGRGALLAGAGLLAGFVIVQLARGALSTVLYQVSPGDASSTITAGALLLVAATIACVPPALRAMRVDPVKGLRIE